MKTITEQEILNARMRANGYKKVKDKSLLEIPEDGLKITPKQTKKGLKWLLNLWKTPKDKERLNNPFGYREEEVLKNFKEFRLVDWYDDTTSYAVDRGFHNYLPVYRVIAKDDSYFEYVPNTKEYGKVNITG